MAGEPEVKQTRVPGVDRLTRTALVYRSQAVPFDWVPSGTPREPLRAVGTEAGSLP
ncbi:hypothetical protein BN970_02113 [Mycolicibacterium conceptionense]|uniref:Uncharacterized protein n=1 Tax=Mycolicibacterium conceptionense TaxID=451644 RepID=A0A0U1D959_9MYCO|nr:hypothetical protein BN970_02113 [Mycolicibacterium conceptionense]